MRNACVEYTAGTNRTGVHTFRAQLRRSSLNAEGGFNKVNDTASAVGEGRILDSYITILTNLPLRLTIFPTYLQRAKPHG